MEKTACLVYMMSLIGTMLNYQLKISLHIIGRIGPSEVGALPLAARTPIGTSGNVDHKLGLKSIDRKYNDFCFCL